MKDRAKPGEGQAFIRRALRSQTAGCIDWPYGRDQDGYGIVHWDGRSHRTNGLVCRLTYGPRPQGAQAAHSCGRAMCVNPAHLRWATNGENQRDRWGHGTSNRGEGHGNHKLTADDVRAIRAECAAGGNQSEIGRRYGIRSGSVNNIVARRSWAWLGDAQDEA
jgi:hypothetical protein